MDGRDYVSIKDAKKILGVASAKDLRSLGCATITIGPGKPLWNLNWIIGRAKNALTIDSFHPDLQWIQAYEKDRLTLDTRPKEKLIATPLTSDRALTSSARLNELVKLMPPPDNVPCKDIDWPAVENAVGLDYPASFKAFIEVYGALQWFDWLQPLVPFESTSPEQFREYLSGVFQESFGGDTVNTNGELVFTPKFGTPGCWLPFMTGSDGDTYAWLTNEQPAETWSVIYVLNRRVTLLPPTSIGQMIVGWLNGESLMQQIWGSVEEFRRRSPERLSMLR